MSTQTFARFDSVERRSGFYRQAATSEADKFRQNSADSSLCFDLAEIVDQGCGLYHSVNKLDEDWRTMIADRRCEYDSALEARLEKLYHDWLGTSRAVLDIYRAVESQYANFGYDLAQIDDLHRAVREVEGIFTKDSGFFCSDKFVELRDAAIDDHRGGNTTKV